MIYLDHAAATPVDERVVAAMEPYWGAEFFNPSAAYLPAKRVAEAYAEAKGRIAHAIGARGASLVMTSGATEANNLAFSVVGGELGAGSGPRGRVLYLATEHDSVRKVAERYGGAEIKVGRDGRILIKDLREKLDDEVVLVSVALANGEMGTVQPLAEIAGILREARFDRLRRGVRRPLFLHSDASQALNLLEVNVARLGVDMMTLNAAKVYGPKGVGALYVAPEVRLFPVTFGGGQERGLRAGTENVPGVVGFAKAVELAREHMSGRRRKYAEMKKVLLEELQGYELIGGRHQLDNFVNLCYNEIDGERLVFSLEEEGVFVATGAACAASKGVRSHVLKAIGLSEAEIEGSLRLTLGKLNTVEQMHEAARLINLAVERERR